MAMALLFVKGFFEFIFILFLSCLVIIIFDHKAGEIVHLVASIHPPACQRSLKFQGKGQSLRSEFGSRSNGAEWSIVGTQLCPFQPKIPMKHKSGDI